MSVSINEDLSEQQQMLVLLQSELDDYIRITPKELWHDDTVGAEFFNALAQKVDNLGRAAELIGLSGFAFCCDFLVKNFLHLAAQLPATSTQTKTTQHKIAAWPKILFTYLQTIIDKGFTAQAYSELSAYIAGDFWPCRLTIDEQAVFAQYLSQTAFSDYFIQHAEATLPHPDMLTLAHAALIIPPDVRPELMSALLLELPKQSEIFSLAVEAFLNSGDAEHLLAAQRMAHTIKGAANVVGVAGLANLMHYAEDLLDKYLHKQDSVLILYADLLLATADCLAEITEYFQGFAVAPSNVMALLEALLLAQHNDHMHASQTKNAVLIDPDMLVQKTPTPNAQYLFADAEDADLFSPEVLADVESSLQNVFSDAFAVEVDNDVDRSHLNTEKIAFERSSETSDYPNPAFNLSISDEAATELLRAASEVKISNFRLLSRVDANKQFLSAARQHHKKLKRLAESFMHFSDSALAEEREIFTSALHALMADSDESLKDLELALQDLMTIAIEQKTMVEDLHARAVNIRLLPASHLTSRCTRAVRQTSLATQKQAQLRIDGGEVSIDSRVLSSIIDPLLHLIRNAIDHGLEHPSVRRQLGKPDEGQIKISFERIGDALRIAVQDDGAGIDYAQLQHLAVKRCLLLTDKNYSPQELHAILLTPGFSTRTQVTQSSGRGIGLDVVNAQVKNLRGELTLHSVLGEGTSVVLTLPMSILSAHLLVVRSQQHRLAVISRGIEQIIYFKRGDLTVAAQTTSFVLHDETLPVYGLHDLYRFNTDYAVPVNHGALLIVKSADGQRCAIAVESLESGENYVIKPLNRYCFKPVGVVGAVILGCGGVAPVIDLKALPLINKAKPAVFNSTSTLFNVLPANTNPYAKPVVLIVDDSLSIRQALAFILSVCYCDIVFAKDGIDAIAKFQERQPALVITDLEMPRLNGLELARHIRREKNAFDVPILMLSSRNTEEHRMLAVKAEINAYLTKPWNDDEVLETLQLLLPALMTLNAAKVETAGTETLDF